jgi:Lipopolysaccharide-assembly
LTKIWPMRDRLGPNGIGVVTVLLLSLPKPLPYNTAIDVLSTIFLKRDDLMKRFVRAAAFAITLLTVSGFTECYKPVTKSQMPAYIKTVAVPAFQNNALRFKIEHRFTEAVMNELIRRGHGLHVQSEREGADAVIDGVVKSFGFSGVLLDDKGRARVFEVTITAAVTVRDQHENRVLYDNQNFVFRGEFEFADDPRNFFNEEDPAVQRIARSFAESIVSTLINGFGVKYDK